MVAPYLLVKFFHVTLAVLAGGTSASLGIWLEFMTKDLQARAAILRGIHRFLAFLVIPGLVVQALLGVWLVEAGPWRWDARWLQAAVALWVLLMLAVLVSYLATRRLTRAHMEDDERAFRTWFRGAQVSGGIAGVAFLAILFVMVTKV